MKILFVSHMFPNIKRPLNGTFVLDLAYFINKKIPVTVLSPIVFFPFIYKTKKYFELNKVPLYQKIKGVKVYYPKIFIIPKYLKFLQGFFYAFNGWRSSKTLINNCDIIVAHWTYPDGFASTIWAKIFKKKSLLFIHGNESIDFYDSNSIRKIFINITLKNADHIIAVSNDLKNKMINFFKVDADKISVVPNGVDFNIFITLNKKDARKQLNLPEYKKILLTVSRLSPEKALDVLIKTIILTNDLPDFVLYIIGDGPEKNNLDKMIKENNLDEKIILIGGIPHDNIHLWMSSADILILPSLREGMPVVIGEAFACGTPVIASSVGGIPDLIDEKKTGLLITPNSVTSLASALRNGLEIKWDRDYIRKFSYKLDWNIISEKIISIINKTIINN